MKWETRYYGQRRTRTKLALWPVKCDDGMTRWLERVVVTEEYFASFSGPHWRQLSAVAV